jgi:hypothetical protein
MLVTATLLLASLSTAATEVRPAAHWTDTCQFGEHTVTANFESQSGDAFEDDLVVTLTRDDGLELRLPIPPSLYKPRHPLLNVRNRCEEATAVDAGGQRVLLLLSSDGRPGWDTLDAVLIDTGAMQMIDAKFNIGPIKGEDDVLVLRRDGPMSFSVRLVREMLHDSGCDCAAAAIEDWRTISVVDDRIRSAWNDAPK